MSSDEAAQAGPDESHGTGYANDRAHALRTLFPAAASNRTVRPAPVVPAPPAVPAPADVPASVPADPGKRGPGRRRGLLLLSSGVLIGVAASAVLFWLSPSEPAAQPPSVAPTVDAYGPAAVGGALPTAAGSVTPSAPATPSPEATVSAPPSQPATPTATPSPSGPAAPVNVGRPNPNGRNLALRRPVAASSMEAPHFSPAEAVDGDLGTRWSSGFSDPQWIQVDLGALWRISSVTLVWEHSYATAYRVQTSADGRRWATGYATTTGTGGTVRLDVRGTDARFLRVYGTKRHNQYGYSLLEIEVR